MGLFYVYIKNELASSNKHYLAVFVDREAADEWWRMISVPPSPYVKSVERISPQFYIQNTEDRNVINFLSRHEILPQAKQFHRKMHTMILGKNSDGKVPIAIPPATITDHISGGWYFIRSSAGSSCRHWHLRLKGECLVCGDANCDTIHVSTEYRTKFRVLVRNQVSYPRAPKTLVMIGKDEITITAPKGYILHISDTGDLKATEGYQGETDLLFGDLKNRFITRAEKQANGEVREYVESVERGLGETWELVD